MCFPNPGLGLFVQNKDRRKREGFPKQVVRRPIPGAAGGGRGGGQRLVLENENELKSGSCHALISDFLLGLAALRAPRGLSAGDLRSRSFARVCEQMLEGVLMHNGPQVSGMKTKCQPLSFFPLLGSPDCPRSLGLSLQLCRSAGLFICEWSKRNFSKGSSLQKMKSKQLGMNGSSSNGKSPLALRGL